MLILVACSESESFVTKNASPKDKTVQLTLYLLYSYQNVWDIFELIDCLLYCNLELNVLFQKKKVQSIF